MLEVSERALIGRINRKLAPDLEAVRRCSPHARDYHQIGRYYLFNHRLGFITGQWIDLADMANDLGVLRHYERFDEPE